MLLAAANIGERPVPQTAPAVAPPAPARDQSRSRGDEQAWLRAIAEGAGGEALSGYRKRIFRTGSGQYYVPVADERRAILALRDDPAARAAIESFEAPTAPTAIVAASAAVGTSKPLPRQDLKGRVVERADSASANGSEIEKLASAGWRAVVKARPRP